MRYINLIKITVIIVSLFLPSPLQANYDKKRILGAYQTIAESRQSIVVDLRSDNTAIIDILEKTYERDKGVVVQRKATWSFDGVDVEISYNGITEVLRFHEKLSFAEFGIEDGVPGLKAPSSMKNQGMIGSTSLWKSVELEKMSRFKFKLKGIPITESDYNISIIYILLPGLFLLALGILFILKRLIFLRRANQVNGEIVSYSERFPIADHEVLAKYLPKVRFPKIRFIAENGTTYEFVDNFLRGWLSNRVGSSIPVLYNPKDPRKAFIKDFLRIWGVPLLISISGALILYFLY